MNIALFGGTFDPPHLGHALVADTLIARDVVDAVWFVPVHTHPWADRYSKKKLTKYTDRVHMLQLITHDKSQIIAHFKQVSFTYDTLEYFSAKHPEHQFSWVMGSEYLSRFDDFLKGHPLLSKYHFYIYPRSGYSLDESLKKTNMTFLHEFPQVVISSSAVRAAVHNGADIDALVESGVAQYIDQKNLYK